MAIEDEYDTEVTNTEKINNALVLLRSELVSFR